MKIINIGLDSSILNKNSKLANRAIEYGNLVEKYIVIVPFKENQVLELSDKAVAYGVEAKNKIKSIYKIYKLANKLIVENNIDVVSVQDQYYLGLISYLFLLTRKFKKGLEIQVHGFEKYHGIRRLIAKFVLPRVNAIRCVSQRLKKCLINEFGVREERITVVPIYSDMSLRGANVAERNERRSNPVNNDSAEIASSSRGGTPRNDKFVFLTVGRLVPVKNIGMQIEAISEVVKKYPDAELWIIGEGPERKNLEKLSYELRATSYVKFFGWLDDLEKFYSQAYAFLLTSNYEGWGLAVIEAAAHGLPIIMTDVGCAGEIIKGFEHAATNGVHANDFNNVSGIVIPVGDKEKLEQAMIKLMEDENLRKKLGDGARAAIKELPSKEETLNLYKKSWEKALLK